MTPPPPLCSWRPEGELVWPPALDEATTFEAQASEDSVCSAPDELESDEGGSAEPGKEPAGGGGGSSSASAGAGGESRTVGDREVRIVDGHAELPEGLTSVPMRAFEGCKSLKSIALPSSVTTIGQQAFRGCSSLAAVSIPSSVTEIGIGAFQGCTSLAAVTLAAGVATICATAFSGCTSLASISIPSTVTELGGSAFHCCDALKSADIPQDLYWDSAGVLGDGAFPSHTEVTRRARPPFIWSGVSGAGAEEMSEQSELKQRIATEEQCAFDQLPAPIREGLVVGIGTLLEPDNAGSIYYVYHEGACMKFVFPADKGGAAPPASTPAALNEVMDAKENTKASSRWLKEHAAAHGGFLPAPVSFGDGDGWF